MRCNGSGVAEMCGLARSEGGQDRTVRGSDPRALITEKRRDVGGRHGHMDVTSDMVGDEERWIDLSVGYRM